MILDITYSNIRVFRDEVIFSMEATDSKEKADNIIYADCNDKIVRVLKVGEIYGPNASGKTTIIAAIHSLRDWWHNVGTDYFSELIAPYRLDDFSSSTPSSITIRFILNQMLLKYSVSFLQGKCVNEILEREIDENTELLFKRVANKADFHNVEIGNFPGNFNAGSLRIEQGKSVLAIFTNLHIPVISDAANYLASLEIANGYNAYMLRLLFNQVRPWLKKNDNTKRLTNFINCFDINVKNLKIPQKPDSSFTEIKYVHPIKNIGGEVIHVTDFPSDLESLGTRTFTVLGAKVLQALDEGRTLFIDELDSGFHTEVTRTIIAMFRDPEINHHNAQLIITTHNVKLMDEQTLRKDQVWFIQKNEDGQSELYSLAEFDEVEEYSNFSQWYLAKRFGATPNPNMLQIRRLFSNPE